MAGHDVQRQVRPRGSGTARARSGRAGRSCLLPGLAHGAVLRREGRASFEHVGVDRHVDDLRETRVRDLAVVALEKVLAADLPVRLVLAGRALEEAERVEVDAGRGDALRQLAEGVLERSRLAVRIDEDERPPARLKRARGRAPPCRSRTRARSAAPRAASRRGRTSRRGTGTGASRACPRPRRRASRGGGTRSGRRGARPPCRAGRRSAPRRDRR